MEAILRGDCGSWGTRTPSATLRLTEPEAKLRAHGCEFSGRLAFLAGAMVWMLLATTGSAAGQSLPTAGGSVTPAPPGAPDGKGPGHNVLVLYTEPRMTPSIVSIDRVLSSTLRARSPVPIYL